MITVDKLNTINKAACNHRTFGKVASTVEAGGITRVEVSVTIKTEDEADKMIQFLNSLQTI